MIPQKSPLGRATLRRRQDLFIPPITLDRAAPEALARQIHRQIASSIRNAPADARLPSTRLLSKLLNVSRNTVLARMKTSRPTDSFKAPTAPACLYAFEA
jgi:hypothetical protein